MGLVGLNLRISVSKLGLRLQTVPENGQWCQNTKNALKFCQFGTSSIRAPSSRPPHGFLPPGLREGWSSGPGCLKSQSGQISIIFSCFGTIEHFLAPFGVLTPTSILKFADFFYLRAELWAQMQILKKKSRSDFLDIFFLFEF